MKLLEVFRDFEVVVRGGSQYGKYPAYFKVVPRENPRRLTVEDLRKYVEGLQKRYPNRNFYLRRTSVRGKEFYCITRKSYRVGEDGRRHRVRDRVPIYVDLEEQKFYVPRSYVERQPKLTNYIVMVTLGALGVSQSKYMGTAYGGERSDE